MAATAAPPGVAVPHTGRQAATLAVLLAGIFVTTLDVFIVNVAIPAIQHDLAAGPATVQWVVAGFGLALAAGLITGGRLGDIAGRRRMYMLGLGLFTLTSLACGLAPTAGVLVAARVAQGTAAAMLMPQILGIVNVAFTGAARARAFTAYGVTMGFGGVFGQLIGGALIAADLFGSGWRAIFLINVPVGLVALLASPRLVPDSRGCGATRLDLPGAALVAAAMVAVVLPLIEGTTLGWPTWSWLLPAAAPALLAAFVAHQHRLGRRGGAPLVDLAAFRARSFAVGSTIALIYALTTAAFFLILAVYLQAGHGLSALRSGLVFATLGGGYFLTSTLSGRVAARLGRQVLTLGALVQFAGCALLALAAVDGGVTAGTGWSVPGMVLVGAGMGLMMGPLSALALSDVAARHAASAAGTLSTGQQVGGALGVAVVGIAFYTALGTHPAAADYAPAFVVGLVPVAAACLTVAILTQALPRPRTSSR